VQWYQRKYKRPESSPAVTNPFAEVLGADITKAQRKISPFHYYIKNYYPSRIKEEHDRRYALAKKKIQGGYRGGA
jgi:hypothetical protein